jgi:CRP-like cAMP-binding protein
MEKILESLDRFLVEYKAGDLLFCEGEIGLHCYMIKSGKVKLIKIVGQVEKMVDIIQPSGFVGEMALLMDTKRTATAIAVEDVQAYCFQRDNFDQLFTILPDMRTKLLRIFSARIYDQKRQEHILQINDDAIRVADVLLMLYEKQTHLPSEGKVILPVNIDGIANWAGMAPEDARKALTVYANQNRIEIYPDRIIIRNISEIQRLVTSRRATT